MQNPALPVKPVSQASVELDAGDLLELVAEALAEFGETIECCRVELDELAEIFDGHSLLPLD